MKIALLGGGFISSHLEKRLKELGHEVKVFHHDDDVSGVYDVVFYLQSYGNRYSQDDVAQIFKANVWSLFLNLLGVPNTDRPSRDNRLIWNLFIHISTSSVTLPYQTMYSATKHAAEHICEAIANKYNKNIVSVRPYTVVGVGEPEEHLIPQLIKHAYSGEPMEVIPYPVHDFINVKDFVDYLIRVMDDPPDHFMALEAGTGVGTRNDEVVYLVDKLTQPNKLIVKTAKESMRPYDAVNWVCTHGIKNYILLEDTIKEMVDDYKRKMPKAVA